MSPRPILVTGMPRSGTTWVARKLASSTGAALTGREPMNARQGQYALGGTLVGWARLTDPTPRQQRLLRWSYRGFNPLVYSRYGHRQWAAPVPSTRLVVKDPFAVLSLPSIVRVTGAFPVLVFRHPGAVLASFRRMNWLPDVNELEQLESIVPADHRSGSETALGTTDLELVARMWNLLYRIALDDLNHLDNSVVVSHQGLASGGSTALAQLRQACDLQGENRSARSQRKKPHDEQRLHNLDREPQDVADAWREHLDSVEIERIEAVTSTISARLDARALGLGSDRQRSETDPDL